MINLDKFADGITKKIATTKYLVFHTIFLVAVLALSFFGFTFEKILLFLTSFISLEALYVAILIQRSVIKQEEEIHHVEESIDKIEEEMEDIEEEIHEKNKKPLN